MAGSASISPSSRVLTNITTVVRTDLLESDFIFSCAEIQVEGVVLVSGGTSKGGGGGYKKAGKGFGIEADQVEGGEDFDEENIVDMTLNEAQKRAI